MSEVPKTEINRNEEHNKAKEFNEDNVSSLNQLLQFNTPTREGSNVSLNKNKSSLFHQENTISSLNASPLILKKKSEFIFNKEMSDDSYEENNRKGSTCTLEEVNEENEKDYDGFQTDKINNLNQWQKDNFDSDNGSEQNYMNLNDKNKRIKDNGGLNPREDGEDYISYRSERDDFLQEDGEVEEEEEPDEEFYDDESNSFVSENSDLKELIEIYCEDYKTSDYFKSEKLKAGDHQNYQNLIKLEMIEEITKEDEEDVVKTKITDFKFLMNINKGGYGRVDLYKKKKTNDIYAIKTVVISNMVRIHAYKINYLYLL